MITTILQNNTKTKQEIQQLVPDYDLDFRVKLGTLLLADILEVFFVNDSFIITLCEYDFVAKGYTSYKELSQDDVCLLYRMFEHCQKNAAEAWLTQHYKKCYRDSIAASLSQYYNLDYLQQQNFEKAFKQ